MCRDEEDAFPILMCSQSREALQSAFRDVKEWVKAKGQDYCDIDASEVCLLNTPEDLQDAARLEQFEKAKIQLLNDKCISKLVLSFDYHGPPRHLLNLDLPQKYCSFLKRISTASSGSTDILSV